MKNKMRFELLEDTLKEIHYDVTVVWSDDVDDIFLVQALEKVLELLEDLIKYNKLKNIKDLPKFYKGLLEGGLENE